MKNFLFTLCCVALLAGCQPAHAGTSIDVRNSDGTIDPLEGTSGQPAIAALAGERIEGSTTGADYSSVSRECDAQTSINLATDASTTINGPTILCGYSLTVSVGTEAVTIDDDTTAKVDLPIAWPIGNYTNMDLLFRTSLVVNPGTTSTGTIRLWTRPGSADVTR